MNENGCFADYQPAEWDGYTVTPPLTPAERFQTAVATLQNLLHEGFAVGSVLLSGLDDEIEVTLSVKLLSGNG